MKLKFCKSHIRCLILALTITFVTKADAQILEDTLVYPSDTSLALLRWRTDIESNANGEVWMSIKTLGLYYYDGLSWMNYNSQSTSGQLPSDEVHKLFLDGNSALWIANSLSLTRMDSNGFKNYFFPTPYNFTSNPITDLAESQGKVFLSSRNGLQVLDTLTSVWQSYSLQNSLLPNDTINSLFVESSGIVWISTKFGFAKYDMSIITPYSPSANQLPVNEVLSMAITPFDTLVAGANDVLYRKSGSTWINMDSICFGTPHTSMWCDSVSFGKVAWEGANYNFTTNLMVKSNGDIYVLRSINDNTGIFVINVLGQLNYIWASTNLNSWTVADFYKSDSILIGGGFPISQLRIIETPVFGNYTVCDEHTGYLPPYGVEFTVPPSYVGGNTENLEGNMIRSTILNRGDWAWNPVSQVPQYEVPRGSGTHSVYAAAIWMGGFDASGNLYTAAMSYRQMSSYDFQPGPLDTMGLSDSVSRAAFDHIWLARKSDIDEFRYQYAMGNVQNGTFQVSSFILNWPAFYNDPAYPQKLAPFVDVNSDAVYNPLDGDYPEIKGDQMSWCVFNDDMTKTETNSPPMNVEIQATATASNCNNTPDALGRLLSYTTFYHFDVFNRGNIDFDSCYFGIWTDVDLGNASDDLVGCNLSANSFFVYNGDANDDGGGGFGLCAPTQNVSLLAGPEAPASDGVDNNHDGVIDESNEDLGLSGFLSYENVTFPPYGNPNLSLDYYHYISGYWQNGAPVTYGGNGIGGGLGATSNPTTFMFPDTSNLMFSTPWNMQNAGLQPSDMRGTGSFGPFNLPAGSSKSFDIAFITGPNNLVQNNEMVRQLRHQFRNGMLNNHHSSIPAIQGPTQITSSGVSVTYLLPYSGTGTQYLWTVTNGLILSGQGTNSIIVTWGTMGVGEVKVEVTETANPCGMSQKLPVIIGSQGFGQISDQLTVRVFPNPTQHLLQIESPDVQLYSIDVLSGTGQLLLSKPYEGSCDVSILASGMYFLELKDEKGVVRVRKMFLKQ